MKIKTKMLLALSSLPILLLLVIGSGFVRISHLNNTSDEIHKGFDSSILAGSIRVDIKDQGMNLRNLIIYTNENAINDEIIKIEAESEKIQKNIQTLEQIATNKKQKELVGKLNSVNSEFEAYKNQMVSLINANKKEEARQLIDESSEQLHENFTLVLREITSDYDAELEKSLNNMVDNTQSETSLTSIMLAVAIVIIMLIILRQVLSFTRRITTMSKIMKNIAAGKISLTTKIDVISNDEFDGVANSFNQMTDTLDKQIQIEKELTWRKSHIAEISSSITGKRDLEKLGKTLLSKVVPLIEGNYAVFYVRDIKTHNNEVFHLISTFALQPQALKKTIQPGEGLLGQAIIEKRPTILTDVPTDYLRISSGLGEATPAEVVILPILFEGEVNAVLEIASLKAISPTHHVFLEELVLNLGIVLESVIGRIQLTSLLEETQTLMEEIQAQSEELQNQQEELKATNEELEEQTQSLRHSETKLQMQQEELEQTNAELEEKAKSLEKQNMKYEEANRIVEQARRELEIKAEQLALSSKYKSEFLANMSHELRTPLNSLIILSKLLADNPSDNLSDKQVEYAKTIYSSGNDLLVLINNILDLAKIESGKTDIIPTDVSIQELVEFVESNFAAIAESKNISFKVHVEENAQAAIFTDQIRIQQILKNLLSNAFKFTSTGEVALFISQDSYKTRKYGKPIMAFSVVDTGIGISNDKLELIFEAFQQADGTTSRKYGGTGLGLSISRELAALLGGVIEVESKEGKGSKFTFYVGNFEGHPYVEEPILRPSEVAAAELDDNTGILQHDIQAVSEPITSQSTQTSHIKRLLIVDDDLNQRNSLMELIGNMDFIIKGVSSGKEAIETLKVEAIDCIILDLGLLDTNGFDLLAQIRNNDANQHISIFIYTGRDLSLKEENELNKLAQTIIIKNEHSPDRLVAELQDYLEASSRQSDFVTVDAQQVQPKQGLLGKKILLVDDDIRNVFALSSVLEQAGMDVVFAENGLESLAMLDAHPDVEIVLMDIMMPEMDGYEAIAKIRQMPIHQNLPVIALTAKAMKEDREKCLEIGASDYIAKPVEPDQLISLITVWLY
ncbi:response regulator [Ureibacillus sinduriensis]|uniref:response regulator n=1 Tax=Ureibacillus sinduriensis TaxID=561440 RepID=UPI00068A3CBD|nr:response regulator [Ureibacillus sinduriensis]